ncbi:hypothetical protein PRZ48_014059 [Zasmidium cellare]|uniref:PQ loop repeat protein n=1 Tax=Zasmidium cellare TaxID=395010 RepID=A0ABR0DZV7_ZASCE|nr:hypothetical protein PRZ48_014059 [Zasmidium cellare]
MLAPHPDLSEHCQPLAEPGVLTTGLAALLVVGILVSYLPQHAKIIKRRTSDGLSPCIMLYLIFFPSSTPEVEDLSSSTASITKSDPVNRRDPVIVGSLIFVSLFIVAIVSIILVFKYPDHTQFWADMLGTIAGVLAAIQYVPQIYYTKVRKDLKSLSITTLGIQAPGAFVFALSLGLRVGWQGWSTWLVYIVTGLLQFILLFMGIRFWNIKRKERREAAAAEAEQRRIEAEEDFGAVIGGHVNRRVSSGNVGQVDGVDEAAEAEADERTALLYSKARVRMRNENHKSPDKPPTLKEYLWRTARKAIPTFWRDQKPKDRSPSPVSPTSPEPPPPPKRMNPPKPIWIDPAMRKAEEAAAEAAARRSHSIAVSQPLPRVQTLSEEDEEQRKAIEEIVNPAAERTSPPQTVIAVVNFQGYAQRRASRQALNTNRDISLRLERGDYKTRKTSDDEHTLVDEVDWADPKQVAARKASWQEFSISAIHNIKGKQRQIQVEVVNGKAQDVPLNPDRPVELPFGHPYNDPPETQQPQQQQNAPEIGPRPPTDAERKETGRRRASEVLTSFLPPLQPSHDFPAIGRRRWTTNDDTPLRAEWRSKKPSPLLLPDAIKKDNMNDVYRPRHLARSGGSPDKLPGGPERMNPGPSRTRSCTPPPYRHSHNPVTNTHNEDMFIITTRQMWRRIRRSSAPEMFHIENPTRHVDDPGEGTRRGLPVALQFPLSAQDRARLLVTLSKLDQHLDRIHLYRGADSVYPTLFNQNRRRTRRDSEAAVTTYHDLPNVLDSGRDERKQVFERYLSRFDQPQWILLRRFRNPEDDPRGHIGSHEHKEPLPDNGPPLAQPRRDMQGDLAEGEAVDARRRALGRLPRYSSGSDRGKDSYGGFSPETGRKAKTVVNAARRSFSAITNIFKPDPTTMVEPSERRPSISNITNLIRRASMDPKRQQDRPGKDENYIGTYAMLKKTVVQGHHDQRSEAVAGFRMPMYDAAATEQAIEEEYEPGAVISDTANQRQSTRQRDGDSIVAQREPCGQMNAAGESPVTDDE